MVLQLVDVVPQLRKHASEAGGDAIVVRQAGYEGGPNPAKPFNVIADVIRWQP